MMMDFNYKIPIRSLMWIYLSILDTICVTPGMWELHIPPKAMTHAIVVYM